MVLLKKIRLKAILKFIGWFILTYLIIELCEYLLLTTFQIDLDATVNTKAGLLFFLFIYGFKFHIFCCVVPFLFASYKCKHKKCKHEHCPKD